MTLHSSAQDEDEHDMKREEAACSFVPANTVMRDEQYEKCEHYRCYRQHKKKHQGMRSRHHAICTYDALSYEFMHNDAI